MDNSIVFKVQLDKGLWRSIQISLSATLEQLHLAILEAYNFDDDHLYGFFMNNKLSDYENVYWSPFCEEPPYADSVDLSCFRFQKGDKFKYLFDFGDEWIFQIRVVKLLEEETPKPIIFNIKGEAPPQYPNFEDEE